MGIKRALHTTAFISHDTFDWSQLRRQAKSDTFPAMINVGLLALTVLILAPSPMNASGPPPLLPAGKWAMSGENGRCILSRTFSEGSQPITLSIEPLPLDDRLDLIVKTRQRTGRVVGRWASIELGGAVVKKRLFSFDSSDGIHRVHRLEVVRNDLNHAGQSGMVRLAGLDDTGKTFALPGLGPALEVLHQCEQAIIENVGLSKEEIQAIERHAKEPQVLTGYGPKYYELSANGDLEDVAISRYIVSSDGKAGNCGIIHAAKSDWLNQRACSGWPEKFRPATDRNGKKVRGLYFERIRWMRHEEWNDL